MINDIIYLDYNANAPIFDKVKDDIMENLNLFNLKKLKKRKNLNLKF